MKNRAKCRLCEAIIESMHTHDYVTCKCGEIAIDGGEEYLRCMAKNWNNFIRVDDDGNEIIPKIIEKSVEEENEAIQKLSDDFEKSSNDLIDKWKVTKEDLLQELQRMIENIERLPKHVQEAPINHYDFCSLMLLLVAIFRSD